MKSLRQWLQAPGPILGTWSQIDAPEVIDILAVAGFHFTILDAEHGSFGMDAIENLVRACDAANIVPVVRVPALHQASITRALDAGAQAVVVPGVRSKAEAEQAVAGSRFAPHGTRGACPCVRAGGHWISDWTGYAEAKEQETGIIVLAETPEALDEIEGICALHGLAALLIGPFDLSVAMGYGGDTQHPDVTRAVHRMVRAASAAAVPVVLPVFAPDLRDTERQVRYWLENGVRIFTVGTDKILLHSQSHRFVRALLA